MKAVVNVAVGGRYPQGQKRLRQSLVDMGEDAERIFLKKYPGKPHSQVPYGMKVDAFREAQRRGYEQVIWMDASTWLVRPLDTAWARLKLNGYLIGKEGWSLGQWCNDRVLQEAGYTREQALKIPLIEGKMIGLDLSSRVGAEFLDCWEHTRDQGWFNGDWTNHRHDISAGAIVAHEMRLRLTPHLIEFDHRNKPHPQVFLRAAGL